MQIQFKKWYEQLKPKHGQFHHCERCSLLSIFQTLSLKCLTIASRV